MRLKPLAAAMTTAVLAVLACNPFFALNRPPQGPPVPTGPASGQNDSSYAVTVTAFDPDGDSVAVRVAWGDGDTSAWSGFVPSGTPVGIEHCWPYGTHLVSAQARDHKDAVSDWSDPLEVSIASHTPYPNVPLGGIQLPGDAGGSNRHAVAPDGRAVYMAGSRSVFTVNAAADQVELQAQLEGYTGVVALSPDGQRLFVELYVPPQGPHSLVVLRASDLAVLRSVVLPRSFWDILLLSDGGLVYLLHSGCIGVYRTDDLSLVVDVPVPYRPERMILSPDGRHAYVMCEDTLVVVGTERHAVVDTVVGFDGYFKDMTVSLDGEYLYVCCYDTLDVLRTSDNSFAARVDFQAARIAVMPDGSYLLGSTDDVVNVLCLSDHTLVDSLQFPGCECDHPILLLPDGSKFYVITHDAAFVFGHRGLEGVPPAAREESFEQ